MAGLAAVFKGAKKADVEVRDGLAALGLLATYEAGRMRRWKPTRGAT